MSPKKRSYRRRTSEEKIAELESRIQDLRTKVEAKQRKDTAVLNDLPRVKRRLLKFAQLAIDHGREDLSNSTRAFLAGLERASEREP